MTLAAQIRLPKGTSLAKRLERIEHVIIEVILLINVLVCVCVCVWLCISTCACVPCICA